MVFCLFFLIIIYFCRILALLILPSFFLSLFLFPFFFSFLFPFSFLLSLFVLSFLLHIFAIQVILTHDHADATFGLDDLRELQSFEKVYADDGSALGYRLRGDTAAMPIIVTAKTLSTLRTQFPYLTGALPWVPGHPGVLGRAIAALDFQVRRRGKKNRSKEQ